MVLTFDSLEEVLAFTRKVTGVVKEEPAKKEAPKAEPEPEPKPEAEQEPETEADQEPKDTEVEVAENEPVEDTTYSLMDVREVLKPLTQSKEGKAAVRNLFESFGVDKLLDIDPKDYAALIQKAGEL